MNLGEIINKRVNYYVDLERVFFNIYFLYI